MTMRPEVSAARVWELRLRTRLSFREIGVLMADELGRKVPFQHNTIARTYYAEQKRRGMR